MTSFYIFIYALALLGSLATTVHCLACDNNDSHKKHVPLFVFGDSIFDPGNNNYINTTTDFQANYWPYGESFFKYPTGRFSNGRLIPDFIAEFAKLPPIPAYYQTKQRGFINGVNFASGGGGSLVETYLGKVINFKMQFEHFKEVAKQMKGKYGDKESNKLLSNAVYMFSIGNNDYLSPFSTNSTIFTSHTHEEYVDMVIGNFTTILKEIYKEGGRKFIVFSTVPLSCLPSSRAIKFQQTNRSGCLKKFRVLTQMHNKALPKKLDKLGKTLPGFKYSYFDFFKAATNIIDHPSRYGFKEAKTACCGSGPYRGIYNCGRKEYELCKDVEDYLFFDGFHPTEKANLLFATLLWSGAPNLVRPYSVKSLFELV